MGRPSKYDELKNSDKSFLKKITQFCLLGMTNADLAAYFEVHVTAIDQWLRDKPEFLGAVKKGREQADAKVAKALFKRATGYTCKEVTRELRKVPAVGAEGMTITDALVVTKEVEKEIAPDTLACTVWLNNRQRGTGRWKQKPKEDDGDTEATQVFIINGKEIKFS